MMDGSSLRMIVGMNSALGTLEEMSWRQHRGRLRAQLPQTQWAVGGPRRSPPHCRAACDGCIISRQSLLGSWTKEKPPTSPRLAGTGRS